MGWVLVVMIAAVVIIIINWCCCQSPPPPKNLKNTPYGTVSSSTLSPPKYSEQQEAKRAKFEMS